MSAGAQLSVTDQRRSTRHPVDFPVIGEHRAKGDMQLHITNISAHGFMIDGAADIDRGDRVVIRLPDIGRIEAHCIWIAGERSGFQFERILRLDDFNMMIKTVQPNPRLRRRR
ncbi:PilZ domain-containing protein [Alteriqipengyuania flavescens]|uniref:PilZ domain-containing protein n=1 Tax=Alteriqipengyuania flavescens TaxID=3053610 RepID=UPI0025B4E70E|nr:PilZ domain-containing protein [Alteriqipengyuania flavescens]WJY18285.1 PilZ domain-containing protein [Alteriqipengyuania flavescens]WJY24226.1 PilZ domain-containing protein [Alteriqipengyuania flavescens]